MTLSKKFWAKVDMYGPVPEHDPNLGSCWIWRGHRIKKGGYGRLSDPSALVHRLVWESLKGNVPQGFCLDHLCRVTNCVNPAHLEVVTPEENTRRGLPFRKKKTHCLRGHPLSGENLYIGTGGRRVCRICHQAKTNVSQQRRVRRFRAQGLTWEGKQYRDKEEMKHKMKRSAKRRWKLKKNVAGSLKALELGRK